MICPYKQKGSTINNHKKNLKTGMVIEFYISKKGLGI